MKYAFHEAKSIFTVSSAQWYFLPLLLVLLVLLIAHEVDFLVSNNPCGNVAIH